MKIESVPLSARLAESFEEGEDFHFRDRGFNRRRRSDDDGDRYDDRDRFQRGNRFGGGIRKNIRYVKNLK